MNRLTKRNSNGIAYMAIAETLAKWEQEIEGSQAILEGVYAIFQRLADYEDTGLEPEEIGITSGIALQKLLDSESNMKQTLREWMEYKSLEEQGLLIKLPCKVGSIVIVLECNVDIPYIKEEIVIAFELWNKNRIIGLFIRTISGLYEANKTVFLTREEAEKALEGMK